MTLSGRGPRDTSVAPDGLSGYSAVLLWFQIPLVDRTAAADQYDHTPLTILNLATRARNALLRQRIYRSVGDLMRAGDEVRDVRNMGINSLQQCDQALRPLFESSDQQRDKDDLDSTHSLHDYLKRIAQMPDYDVLPWFSLLPAKRDPAAEAWMHVPLWQLDLLPSDEQRLSAYGIAAIGQLLSATVGITLDVSEETLRRAHAALCRFANSYLSEQHALDATIEVLAALKNREDLASMPLRMLTFDPAYVARLKGHAIVAVGDLAALSAADALELLGREGTRTSWFAECRWVAALPALSSSDVLVEAWQSKGLRVIPLDQTKSGESDLGKSVQHVVRALVLNGDEMEWNVLRHRFGLLGAQRLTLQEIGNVFGVTRERIRQLEARALKRLADRLIARPDLPTGERMHPDVSSALDRLMVIIDDARVTPMTETVFVARTWAALQLRSHTSVHPAAAIIADCHGVRRTKPAATTIQPFWHGLAHGEVAHLLRRVRAVHEVLDSQPGVSMTTIEIVASAQHMAPEAGLTLTTLALPISLCSTIEPVSDDRYCTRVQSLTTIADRAVRILKDEDAPLHAREIARRIASSTDRERSGGARTMSNRLSSDSRFIPIGRSGLWALKEWQGVETDSIAEVMARTLTRADHPMTVDALFDAVLTLRQATRASISLYLTMNPVFAKASRNTWGLAAWRELDAAQKWDRTSVAEFARSQFAFGGVREMPYAELQEALAAAASVNVRTARGMLAGLRALDHRRGSGGTTMVVLPNDFEKRVKSAYDSGTRRRTLRDEVSEHIQTMLTTAPKHELTLNAVCTRLVEELKRPKYTIYQYIQRCAVSETFVGDDARTRMVRLRAETGDDLSVDRSRK